MTAEIKIAAVGDVIVNRSDPASMFHSVGEYLRSADVTFGNCETPYSEPELAALNPIGRTMLLAAPKNVPALRNVAGFDVMAFTNNHHMDSGYKTFLRTIELLRDSGIKTVGAGKDIVEARTPAIVEVGGNKIAFLAYASVIFLGYEADVGKPGGAAITIDTVYRAWEEEQPGTSPIIHTYAKRDHLRAMQDDVREAKKVADIVFVSFHMGLHYVRAKIADYETEMSRAAIDAGADAILGHHAHILKGIDWYKGKPVFHNLGNFAADFPVLHAGTATSPRMRHLFEHYPEDLRFHEDYPNYPFSVDARKTIIVEFGVQDKKVTRVSFRPCHVNPDNSPVLLKPTDPMFTEVANYMRDISKEASLTGEYEIKDDLVIVRES